MSDMAYSGEFLLKDNSLVQQDFEQHGWATAEFVDNIKIFTLVPKEPNSGWPLLRMHIPEGAKAVWTWRTFRESLPRPDSTIREMRIYGIGYKKYGEAPYMMWVVPGGHVECGIDEPLFANVLWRG
jgi:hypothetical protein